MVVVLFLLSCLSLLIWCVLLFARGGFWRARPAAPLTLGPRETWPAVAAVVPARNEVDVIAQAVTTLLEQDYPGEFHVIVVDDHSNDGTADAARAAALQLQ
jgi:cellulose synthase/poly-beta-1,6-N-acetylglucosamine synthase-like glycosyltransferase